MTRVEIGNTASEITALMSSYAVMNGVEIVLESEGELYIQSNSVKLKQALMNLMKNGIEAMPKGGSLRVSARREGTFVLIVITDEGEGISPDQIRQIGLPFYSTKEKGTGLGLMVTCRIIDAMNGTIHFESELGKGTRVIIYLPVEL